MKTATPITVRGPLASSPDWTCTVAGLAGAPPDLPQRVRAAIARFVEGGRAGLFAGARHQPWQSDVTVDGRSGERMPTMRCHNVDAGAVRVLANLLAAAIGEDEADLEIHVSDGAAPHRAETAMNAQAVPFPATYHPTPFTLGLAYPEKTLEPITTRIQFTGELADATADILWTRLEIWENVLRDSGYAETLDDARRERGVTASDTYLLSPSQAEYVIYGFWGADAALDGLVNGISRAAIEVEPMAAVEIW